MAEQTDAPVIVDTPTQGLAQSVPAAEQGSGEAYTQTVNESGKLVRLGGDAKSDDETLIERLMKTPERASRIRAELARRQAEVDASKPDTKSVPESVDDSSVLEVVNTLADSEKGPTAVDKLGKFATSVAGGAGIETRLRTLPVKEAAATDIAAQTQTATLESKIEEAARTGKTNIAGTEYDSAELDFILSDPGDKALLQQEMDFVENEDLSAAGKFPFSRDGKFYNADDTNDAALDDAKKSTAKYLKDIDLIVKPFVPEKDLRDIIVKNMGRGVLDVTMQKLAESGRGSITGVPYIASLTKHGTGALYDKFANGTTFMEEFDSRGPQMEGWFNQVEDFFEDFSILGMQPFDTPTIGRAFNESIHELLQTAVKDGEMTEERYEELAFLYDEGTESVVKRNFLTDAEAQDMVNYAYSDLGALGKIVATGTDVAAAFAPWAKSKSISAALTTKNIKSRYLEYADTPILDKNGKQALAKDGRSLVAIMPENRVTDVIRMSKVVEEQFYNVSINRKLLNLGVYQENVNERVRKLEDGVAKAKANLKTVELNTDPGDAARIGFTGGAPMNWRRAKAALDNAESALLRAKIGNVVDPILKEGAASWAITTGSQYSFVEWLASGEEGSMDPQMAGFMGAMFGWTMGGKVVNKTVGITRSLVTEVLTVPGSTRDPNWFSRSADFILFGKAGVLTDRTITDYEEFVFKPANNGNPMSKSQKEGLRQIVRMYKNSSQVGRDRLDEQAEAYTNMIEDVVKSVTRERPDKAAEVREQLHTGFYHLGDMGRLQALGQNSMGTLSLDNLGKSPTLDMIADQMSANATNVVETLIDTIKGTISSSGVASPSGDALVAMMTAGVTRFKSNQVEQAKNLQGYMIDAVANYGKSAGDDVGPALIENITKINKIVADTLGVEYDELADIKKITDTITGNLLQRSEDLLTMDKGEDYFAAASRQIEDLIELRDGVITVRAKEIYKPVREYFESPNAKKIDMSEFVQEFLVEAGREGSISAFFSPSGAFFSGAEGRRIAKTFEDMVNRTYGKETIKQLKQALLDSGTPPAEVGSLTNLQVALRAEQAGGAKVFSAVNGEELDLMMRQLKFYSSKTKNDALGMVATSIQTKLDDILYTQDREAYELLDTARTRYQMEKFDRTRKGNLPETIKANREGPERVSSSQRDASGFSIPVGKETPLEVFRTKVVQDVINVIMQDADSDAFLKSRSSLRNTTQSLADSFGRRGGPNGVSFFDLDDTSPGEFGTKKMFDVLQSTLTNSLMATYGLAERKKLLGSMTASKRVGGTSVEKTMEARTSPFDFSLLNNVLDIDDSVSVTVRKDGKFYEVPILLIDDVLEQANSLEYLASQNAALRTRYLEGLGRVEKLAKTATSEATDTASELSRTAFEQLQSVFPPNLQSAESIYKSMILSRGASYDELVQEMAEAITTSNPNIKDAPEVAQKYIKEQIIEGLLARADVRPVAGEGVTKRNKVTGELEIVIPKAANSPEMPIMDLDEHYDKFVEILGEEHATAVKTIFTYMNTLNKRAAGIRGTQNKANTLRNGLAKGFSFVRGQIGLPYLAGDLAIRIAEDARIDMYRLMATNEDAALLTSQLLRNMPVKKEEAQRLGNHLMSFVILEINAAGQDVTYYVERQKQLLEPQNENEQ